jgi:Na+-driven multidrug efflux pump
LLIGLLLLPLFVPTLIFGIEAIGAALAGADSFAASFLLLIAVSLRRSCLPRGGGCRPALPVAMTRTRRGRIALSTTKA